ncbi:hypothetical protein GWK47_027064 [Chionoecetes opilio]|uniref:Uncharacterized protein n=1 Tax=Chionoecetes opilio TaxID=41210 RepID=A0A8J8W9T3_CHIOP|nr:hypothetical protein GWK47_027064 [Chionoecetes opilio]
MHESGKVEIKWTTVETKCGNVNGTGVGSGCRGMACRVARVFRRDVEGWRRGGAPGWPGAQGIECLRGKHVVINTSLATTASFTGDTGPWRGAMSPPPYNAPPRGAPPPEFTARSCLP